MDKRVFMASRFYFSKIIIFLECLTIEAGRNEKVSGVVSTHG